jgi:hypothetical protein
VTPGAAVSKRRRLVYRVKAAHGEGEGWMVTTPAGGWWWRETKRGAVSLGRTKARMLHEDEGRMVQLVVHGRDGRIQYEHTYGRDPARRKG